MSEPSIQNIDKWMFELHEGNLSPGQEEILMDFVARHPEFKTDLEAWSQASVSEEKFVYNTAHLERNKRKIAPILYIGISLLVGLGLGSAFYMNNNTLGRYQAKTISTNIDYTNDDLNSEFLGNSDKNALNLAKVDYSSERRGIPSKYSKPKPINTASKITTSNTKVPSSLSTLNSTSGKEPKLSSNSFENRNTIENRGMVSNQLKSLVASLDRSKHSNNDDVSMVSDEHNDGGNSSEATENHSTQLSIKKEFSLKRNVYKLSKSINRAMSNPVALKNFRDAYYTLPSATSFELNSAFVGTQVAPKLQLTSRAQYLGNNTQKIDNSLFFDAYVSSLKGGIGLDVNYHSINKGAVDGMEIGLSYSPKISLNDKLSFEPSMRFKIGNKQINPNKLTSGTILEAERGRPVQYFNEGETPVGKSLWYRDVQLGFLVNTPWFYIGGSVDNINRHYDNIYSNDIDNSYAANRLFSAQLGTDYRSFSKKTKLATYIIYQSQAVWQELWLGANVNHRAMHFGMAANNNLDLALSAGVDAKKLRFIYNIDYSESRIDQEKYVSHQLTLRYKLKPNRNARRILNM